MAVAGESDASQIFPSLIKEREEEETSKRQRRRLLKSQNEDLVNENPSKALDSSLKRHTALIKRMRQSLGADNNEQILKDIASLSCEKYVEELAGAAMEGLGRCKTEKDVWSAVEVISALHQRFSKTFTSALIPLLSTSLAPPQRAAVSGPSNTTQASASFNSGNAVVGSAAPSTIPSQVAAELKEKDDTARIARQRPVLRVCAELALVGIIRDSPGRSGGEWVMKVLKDLLSNDPSLSSLPLLSGFLKSYARPFLGIIPSLNSKVQIPEGVAASDISQKAHFQADFPDIGKDDEKEELVEKEIRARFKRMCEGYFDNVAKKLVIEHKRLQEQDRKNHEAYIRSGEIFEDRQQAYEKMTKNYEKLLSNCQTLSDLLNLQMPTLPTAQQQKESIVIGQDRNGFQEDTITTSGKWEDEEERRFFEEIQDLRDYVPKSVLGLEGENENVVEPATAQSIKETEEEIKQKNIIEANELENELQRLKLDEANGNINSKILEPSATEKSDENDEDNTPTPSPPKSPSAPQTPILAPQGPSQLLTALLARLPDCTNRSLIDSAAVDFAFHNSKASRKRLIKFLTQVPRNRIDLLPHYSRLVATLNKYMPDIGAELVSYLDDEFRYLQRKKLVKELSEVRQKNIAYISNLTKFGVVPIHVILHMYKVCLDDFSATNIYNLSYLLEGCGRYLLRHEETKTRFMTMIELLRRKQSLYHLNEQQIMMLENAYYQCNPPERAPIKEKERSHMELFIRHLIYDVLSKKSIDKVLKLLRKLHWEDTQVVKTLHNVFTKVWKIKYSTINLLAMLAYDLHRYHPEFSLAIVDQVLENIRRGFETNIYNMNQQRVSTIKYLGELYIYRLVSSKLIFDTLWSLVTFGHPDGKPLLGQPCVLDMPDDYFRIRLVCVLLDTCGMCFDKGSQKKRLDNFLIFFQMYLLTKDKLPMDVEFMIDDSLEAIRPQLKRYEVYEEAVDAVNEMFRSVQRTELEMEDGGDGSDEGSDEERNEEARHESEDEQEADSGSDSSATDRPPSPDTLVLLNAPENTGPSKEDAEDFERELAKMMTDASAESRKVDKKTAQVLWDSSVMPTGIRKKKQDESDNDETSEGEGFDTMKFVLLSKKGNKQQLKTIAIPSDTALATQTRSAQLQEEVEQKHLKQFVLDYEQREEVEEFRALEARTRNGAIKIRYLG